MLPAGNGIPRAWPGKDESIAARTLFRRSDSAEAGLGAPPPAPASRPPANPPLRTRRRPRGARRGHAGALLSGLSFQVAGMQEPAAPAQIDGAGDGPLRLLRRHLALGGSKPVATDLGAANENQFTVPSSDRRSTRVANGHGHAHADRRRAARRFERPFLRSPRGAIAIGRVARRPIAGMGSQ